MSQDTGAWSVRRPRETLGGISANVGIPPPGSSLKRANSTNNGHGRSVSGSRQSLAMSKLTQPMLQRTSSGANLADIGLSSVRRSSSQPRGALNYVPQTPGTTRLFPDAERRSSVFRPRQSIAGGITSHHSFFQNTSQPAGVSRDPRPLRDRSFQARMGQELTEYMTQNGFELQMGHVLSPNVMKSPTQKDFNYMFQWLYRRIDPNHKFMKNIDQEVPPILKQLKYPYERSITKSQLAAVGGQNWSTFLGLLYWMMNLAQMVDGFLGNHYTDACLEAGVDVGVDHIVFDFLSTAYRDWLDMDENVTDEDTKRALGPHFDRMAKAFEHSNDKYISQLETLEAENARLQKEIEDLEKSMPDPVELDNQYNTMEEDRVELERWYTKVQQRLDKRNNEIQGIGEALDQLADEVKEAEGERRGLQEAVDAKGISMQDIDRMNSDRTRLQHNIKLAGKRLEEVKRNVAEREVEANRRLEELEHLVHRYNTLGYKIAMIPASATNARGKEYELQVTVNEGPDFTSTNFSASRNTPPSAERLLVDATTGYQPDHVLNLDLRGGRISGVFSSLREEIAERRTGVMDSIMHDQELLEAMEDAIEEKRKEVEALKHRVRLAEAEYDKTKEAKNTEQMTLDAQIEKMEDELSKIRSGLSESVQVLEQREDNITIEYEQLVHRASALREELHTETDRMLNDVVKFKMHIQKGLEDYESFVADELERELGVDDAKDDTRAMDWS